MPITFNVNPTYACMSEITEGLYICGVSALSAEEMKKNKITYIINATTEVPNLRSLGDIQRNKLWLEDTPQTYIYPHLELQADQIQAHIRDGGRVLVHCVAGVSRSASICLAYLTKYRCRSLRSAYHVMKAKRPMVRPNLGFWRQLIAFEQNVKCKPSSVRLVHDEAQPDSLLPDVYLNIAIPSRPTSPEDENSNPARDEPRERRNSGLKAKFRPVLETVTEMTEVF